MLTEVVFDVETKTFFDEAGTLDPSKLGVSIVSLYARKLDKNLKEIEGKMLSFWESEFEKPFKFPHFDILAKIKEATGRRTSLHSLAKATLGTQKIDSGGNAIRYWNKGDVKSLNLLKRYCEKDVEITRDIYDYGLKNNILKFTDYWNNPREVGVDFSHHPNNETFVPQQSLF